MGRQPGDDLPEIDVNAMIWEMFKSAIVNSVVHLGQDCQEDVRTNNSIHFEHVTQLFHVSQTLFLN